MCFKGMYDILSWIDRIHVDRIEDLIEHLDKVWNRDD